MERPREKVILYGVDKLSNRELLAILLRTGYHGKSSLEVADEILCSVGDISLLPNMQMADWIEFKGIKEAKAIELLTVFELVRRCSFSLCKQVNVVSSPESMINWLRLEFGHLQQEHFIVVFLNVKNHILGYKTIFVGGLSGANIHPREIFKEAYQRSANKIILVHNHPSQDVIPSKEDQYVTMQLSDVSKIMHIPIMDHIIVSSHNWFSFRKHGLLQEAVE